MNLIARIDAWSRSAPNRLAFVSEARALTYAELTARSDALAAHLSDALDDDRSPVAVLGHKEPEMLVAFLGCIKAGHPYVPLDSSLPRRRIEDIVAASRAQLTLTPEAIVREMPVPTPRSNPTRTLTPYDPFYIMFTSGSTGVPKGVSITLECLVDFLEWMLVEQQFSEGEIFLNQVSYSFDVSVMDTYLSLMTGGTIFSLNRNHVENPARLFQALAESGASIWVSTPGFVHLCMAERRFGNSMLPRLKRFFLAGEVLAPSLVSALLHRFPGAAVWNMYGPTEATVVTTSVRVDHDMLAKHPTVPIGFPKPRTRIIVVDEGGRTVPPGERGEIVIAGPNVSPGYLNHPDANERAFFRLDGERAYRTGDLGHFEDRLLFFDGRLDGQIKLNGYRIEPGDVEAHLSALPSVLDAVVLPVNKNGRVESLQAFVVLRERPTGSDFEISNSLRAQLGERLPAHMLPRRFRFLETFPLTINGKVDRRTLADVT